MKKNLAALTVVSQRHEENYSSLENSALNQVENVEIKEEMIELAQ